MRTNNITVLVLAVVFGGLAAFLSRQWLENHARTAAAVEHVGTIVVATSPLAFGSEMTPNSVTEIPWAASFLPEGAFATKQDLFKDGRRVVLAALERNEPILRSKITGPGQRGSLSSLLQEGSRAVTVRVDDVRGVAGFILPGDFVDVVLIRAEEGFRRDRDNYSDILLQQVKVLAVDQLASERQEQPTVAKAVTLEVTPEQAQKVLLATNIGKLSLILRQPGEKNPQSNRRVTERDLGEDFAKAATPAPLVARPSEPAPTPMKVVMRPETVTVTVVHGFKREDYTVRQENGRLVQSEEPAGSPSPRPIQSGEAISPQPKGLFGRRNSY
jgi:pilus assembly protein CpaB